MNKLTYIVYSWRNKSYQPVYISDIFNSALETFHNLTSELQKTSEDINILVDTIDRFEALVNGDFKGYKINSYQKDKLLYSTS